MQGLMGYYCTIPPPPPPGLYVGGSHTNSMSPTDIQTGEGEICSIKTLSVPTEADFACYCTKYIDSNSY